jgi:hypothetical protein
MSKPKMQTSHDRPQNEYLTKIAQQALGIETLETRHSDRLDFHDLAVWQIEAALRAAYEAGRASVK